MVYTDGFLYTYDNNGQSLCGLCVRPVVYLPATVTLTPDATKENLWNINYN